MKIIRRAPWSVQFWCKVGLRFVGGKFYQLARHWLLFSECFRLHKQGKNRARVAHGVRYKAVWAAKNSHVWSKVLKHALQNRAPYSRRKHNFENIWFEKRVWAWKIWNLAPATCIFHANWHRWQWHSIFCWSWSVGDRFLAAGSALASIFWTLQGTIYGAKMEHGWYKRLFLRPYGGQQSDMFDVIC